MKKLSLTSFQLKIIAIITMTIDHIGVFMIPYNHPAYETFRIIGRVAFVLFAFMVVEGVYHSRNPWKYASRLLLFGIALDAVIFAFTGDQIGNIFLTLGLGAIAVTLIKYRDIRSMLALIPIFFGPFINFLFEPYNFSLYYDYGIYGVGLIVVYSVFYPNRLLQAGMLAFWNFTFLITNQTSEVQVLSILAIPFILLYNGQRGYNAPWVKWIFYIYYPLHLGILVFLNYLHITFFDTGWISIVLIGVLILLFSTKVPFKWKRFFMGIGATSLFVFVLLTFLIFEGSMMMPSYNVLLFYMGVFTVVCVLGYVYLTRGVFYELIRFKYGHNGALISLVILDFLVSYGLLGTQVVALNEWTVLSLLAISMLMTYTRLASGNVGELIGFILIMVPTQLYLSPSILMALFPTNFSFSAIISSNLYVFVILLGALIIGLYIIRWHQRKPIQWLKEMPLAHRGFHDSEAPENSIAAFSNAIRFHYAIELDVHLTLDGELVVFHDDTLQRMCGDSRRINEVPLKEIRLLHLAKSNSKIPLFKEVLDLVHGQVPLIIEIKHQGNRNGEIGIKVKAILDQYKGSFVVQSFNPFIVMWFAEHAPTWARGQLSYHYRGTNYSKLQQKMLHYLLFNFFSRPDFINMDQHSYFPLLKWFRRRIPVISWTARTPLEYQKAKSNFDNIIFEQFHPLEKKNEIK